MQVSARSDYALRAVCALAAAPEGQHLKSAEIAEQQGVPQAFLEQILTELRRAGVVESRRGPDGGHRLARPAYALTLADVVRQMDGPLALVRGERPESLAYDGPAAALQEVYVAVRAALRDVLERTTVEAVVEGRLPPEVTRLSADARSWESVWPPRA